MTIQKFSIILFLLPDDRLVLQRRTKDAPLAPGKLGVFGGRVEVRETPEECLIREIREELSIDPGQLEIERVADFIIPSDKDFNRDRHFYLYKADIPDLNFEVYEGDGAEAFSFNELMHRNDLTSSAKFIFKHGLGKG